jgi:hypothetical protein
MNIHQVVENGRYLENLLQEQAKKIEELERKLEGYIQSKSINYETSW